MTTHAKGATPPTFAVAVTISEPFWAIEDLARVLGVEVDTAREYTYRRDFPGAVQLGGRRNLWVPAEVIGWAYALPRLTAQDRKRTPAVPDPAIVPAKAYKPRTKAVAA